MRTGVLAPQKDVIQSPLSKDYVNVYEPVYLKKLNNNPVAFRRYKIMQELELI